MSAQKTHEATIRAHVFSDKILCLTESVGGSSEHKKTVYRAPGRVEAIVVVTAI